MANKEALQGKVEHDLSPEVMAAIDGSLADVMAAEMSKQEEPVEVMRDVELDFEDTAENEPTLADEIFELGSETPTRVSVKERAGQTPSSVSIDTQPTQEIVVPVHQIVEAKTKPDIEPGPKIERDEFDEIIEPREEYEPRVFAGLEEILVSDDDPEQKRQKADGLFEDISSQSAGYEEVYKNVMDTLENSLADREEKSEETDNAQPEKPEAEEKPGSDEEATPSRSFAEKLSPTRNYLRFSWWLGRRLEDRRKFYDNPEISKSKKRLAHAAEVGAAAVALVGGFKIAQYVSEHFLSSTPTGGTVKQFVQVKPNSGAGVASETFQSGTIGKVTPPLEALPETPAEMVNNLPQLKAGQYPWDWAAESFGRSNASAKLHEGVDLLNQQGHAAEIVHPGAPNEFIRVDGSDDPTSVANMLREVLG